VDDDGAVYFHQADLIALTGGNIVKIKPDGTTQTRVLATSGLIPNVTTLNPANGAYGSSSGSLRNTAPPLITREPPASLGT
jgi:hypothetical protein